MLKQLLVGSAVIAGIAGLGLATPAFADDWPKPVKNNTAAQSNNIVVCGNRGVGALYTNGASLGPITYAANESVNCSLNIAQQ